MSRLSQRHVVRRGLFGCKVILQVADSKTWVGTGNRTGTAGWDNMNWHDASPAELKELEEQEESERLRKYSDTKFFIGQRVKATRGGFHRNAEGKVLFQEPCGGIVWILRDGDSSGGMWYYADELDPILVPARLCTSCKKPYTLDPVITGKFGKTDKIYVSCQNKECSDYDLGVVMKEVDAVQKYLSTDIAA